GDREVAVMLAPVRADPAGVPVGYRIPAAARTLPALFSLRHRTHPDLIWFRDLGENEEAARASVHVAASENEKAVDAPESVPRPGMSAVGSTTTSERWTRSPWTQLQPEGPQARRPEGVHPRHRMHHPLRGCIV